MFFERQGIGNSQDLEIGRGDALEQTVDPGLKPCSDLDEKVGRGKTNDVAGSGLPSVDAGSRRKEQTDHSPAGGYLLRKLGQGENAGYDPKGNRIKGRRCPQADKRERGQQPKEDSFHASSLSKIFPGA
jgi:hypothetical protein